MPRLIAYYLPQFHPIPENDAWWGAGFTEWRNVVKAKPQFRGHHQPHLPADLGFYDLRLDETREAQAALARKFGVSGFCYYHYWFNGRRLLETPVARLLATKRPDFPFCLSWANENWSRNWDGGDRSLLVQQEYSQEDDLRHVRSLLPTFEDDRYIKVDGKPLFLVYRASLLPSPQATTELWRRAAREHGFRDLYLCRVESFANERDDPTALGFDAAIEWQPDWPRLPRSLRQSLPWRLLYRLGYDGPFRRHRIYDYAHLVEHALKSPEPPYPRFPAVTPTWDNSPRRPRGAFIFRDSTPELYERWLRETLRRLQEKRPLPQLCFVNAWNEWGEGAHLEPDLLRGSGYLEATARAMAGFAAE